MRPVMILRLVRLKIKLRELLENGDVKYCRA
jgi:hypothetical protein